jgi:hypothetical protein
MLLMKWSLQIDLSVAVIACIATKWIMSRWVRSCVLGYRRVNQKAGAHCQLRALGRPKSPRVSELGGHSRAFGSSTSSARRTVTAGVSAVREA